MISEYSKQHREQVHLLILILYKGEGAKWLENPVIMARVSILSTTVGLDVSSVSS